MFMLFSYIEKQRKKKDKTSRQKKKALCSADTQERIFKKKINKKTFMARNKTVNRKPIDLCKKTKNKNQIICNNEALATSRPI